MGQIYFGVFGQRWVKIQSALTTARAAHELIKGSRLIVYKGGLYGITDTHKDQLNQDLLNFLRE